MAIFSSSKIETIQLTKAGEGMGPGGWDVIVSLAPAWSGTLTFLSNRAAPGAALNLQPTPFFTSGSLIRFAGYPVTTVDEYTIPETGYDLYVLHNWVSGTVLLNINPAVTDIIQTTVAVPVVNGIPRTGVALGAF